MKILVINGDCVLTNSSANLCHLAYIRGLVDSGHDVTLLCADGRDYELDPSMKLPDTVHIHTYYGVSFYEKLSLRKKCNLPQGKSVNNNSDQKIKKLNLKVSAVNMLKKSILALYGVHGIYSTFVRVAQQFKSDIAFDYIISISTPVTSHLIAYNLLKAQHIRGSHWIQIWEDPWYSDAYGFNGNKKIFAEEKRLLSLAERVCYVSPLTLENQKKLYPESAEKMYWQPLPYYYKDDYEIKTYEKNIYGYFGAYYPATRNLAPFYAAAVQNDIEVNICGDPSNLFEATEKIHIYHRLNLNELKPIENNSNILVFLCNCRGGQIPGKIYQYSATNKVILFILDGTDREKKVIKAYFSKFNRYIFCENTIEDISKAIYQIENGIWGKVKNEPVEQFDPVITIENILNGI